MKKRRNKKIRGFYIQPIICEYIIINSSDNINRKLIKLQAMKYDLRKEKEKLVKLFNKGTITLDYYCNYRLAIDCNIFVIDNKIQELI